MPTLIYNNKVFIHIPKTGGTSISSLTCPTNYFINKNEYSNIDNYLLIHAPINLINEKENNIIKKIAFVRNPYTRFMSIYCMSKNLGIHNNDISIDGITNFCKDFREKNIYNDYIFKPMTYYICDENLNVNVDYVFKYENFDEDILKYCKIMEINIPDNIPYINYNIFIDKTYYNNYFNSYIYEFINDIYNDDFEIFNYTKINII